MILVELTDFCIFYYFQVWDLTLQELIRRRSSGRTRSPAISKESSALRMKWIEDERVLKRTRRFRRVEVDQAVALQVLPVTSVQK